MKNVTFKETIVTSGQKGNKLLRKFISNPVTRSILDHRKTSEKSKLRDYDRKEIINVEKELVFPEAISEEEIEKMSKEELLREYQDISNRLKHDHIKLERRV